MSRWLRQTGLNASALIAFTAAISAWGVLVYELSLERSLDAALETAAAEIGARKTTWSAERRQLIVADLQPDSSSMPLLYIEVIDLQGVIVARSESLGTTRLPMDEGRLARALRGESWLEDAPVAGQRVRLYTAPLRPPAAQAEIAGILAVARPLDPSAGRATSAVWVSLIAAAALSVPLALAVGALMTRSALAPLEGFIGTVRGISDARDLDARLETEPRTTYPAIVRLANEFNRMLARLKSAAQREDEVLEAQRRFVADASHELRTPLTSLRGNIHLLREDVRPDTPVEQAAILADMEAEAGRMTRLVSNLLLLAQADAGYHLVLEPLDMRVVVRRAARSARGLRQDVSLQVNIVPGTAYTVCGDADRLTQVVLILLDNALKFSPSGTAVQLHVGPAERDERAGVQVQVTDSGPGIAPEERERIFERFYRSDRARRDSGTGLGLAIARWIVQEHQGGLEVEPTHGRGGATFSLWLPNVVARPSPNYSG
jgi:signal transduction histidine kinase